MRSTAIISSTSAFSRRRSSRPKREKRGMTESVRFSRTLLESSRPWPRRSSGTSAMPSRPVSAWRGERGRHRLAPQLDRRPSSGRRRTAPGTARAGHGPAGRRRRAPRPRGGRGRRPCRRWPTVRSRTLQRDAVGRGRRALRIEALHAAAEHLGDDLVVARPPRCRGRRPCCRCGTR